MEPILCYYIANLYNNKVLCRWILPLRHCIIILFHSVAFVAWWGYKGGLKFCRPAVDKPHAKLV